MNSELEGAIMFAISAVCFFVAFSWMSYALIIESASAGIGLIGIAVLAFIAGIWSSGVFAWVSYKCFRRYKKSQPFSVKATYAKGENVKLWKLDRAESLAPDCEKCPKTEAERRSTCMGAVSLCDVYTTREKWTEIKSK